MWVPVGSHRTFTLQYLELLVAKGLLTRRTTMHTVGLCTVQRHYVTTLQTGPAGRVSRKKALASKSNNLSSIPGTYLVKDEN